MRRIILRMIAAGSLSAFSTAVAPGAGATSPVRPARSPEPLAPTPQTVAPPALASPQPDAGKLPGVPAGKILPRGSLLDLSV